MKKFFAGVGKFLKTLCILALVGGICFGGYKLYEKFFKN
jgi:hypothetical protein